MAQRPTGDEPMDVDTNDDFIKGCYSLEIGIKRLRISRFWIRAEYIRIYNALEAYYQKRPSIPNQAPAAVITGQPGIGESGRPNVTYREKCLDLLCFTSMSRRKEASNMVPGSDTLSFCGRRRL